MANGFKELKPFRYWCAKVLPMVYDNSLSYYELLGKVIEYLNVTMEDVDLLNNYFDGIEVQEEIDNALDRMAEDGTLSQIIKPYVDSKVNPALASIPTYVSNWLNANIEAGDLVIDESFTTFGACADAFKTGDIFRRLNCFDLLNYITQTNTVHNGVSYQWDGSNRCSVSGTATDVSRCNFYDENGKLIGYPYPCYPNDVVHYQLESTDNHIYVNVFYYIDGEWVQYHKFNSDFTSVVPSDAVGMLLRLEVNSGAEVDGSIKVHAYNVSSNEALVNGVPVLLPSVYDCQIPIMRMLAKYGGVQLCKGTYYIGGTITMPENTTLRGMGTDSIIQMRGDCVIGIYADRNCNVENVKIHGGSNDAIQAENLGKRGILIDGELGSNYIYNPRITNVTICNVAGAGIQIERTGGHPLNSPTIVGCQMYYCHVGIQTNYGGEYCRVIGCSVFNCYHGVENSSGNNKFIGCDFSSNTNGLMIGLENAPEGYSSNNGHSTFTACTFNHSDSNDGYAIIVRDLLAGIVFEGCQFWYGKLYAIGCDTPMLFNGCEFRGTADTSFYMYQANAILVGCLLQSAFSNSVSQGSVVYNNCYLMDMTPIT